MDIYDHYTGAVEKPISLSPLFDGIDLYKQCGKAFVFFSHKSCLYNDSTDTCAPTFHQYRKWKLLPRNDQLV